VSKAYRAIILVAGLLLGGCATFLGNKEADQAKEKIVVRTTETDAILTCLAESKKISPKAFNGAYKTALADVPRPESTELAPLICLSLRQQATYKQFRTGIEVLARYVKAHPERAPSLQGLLLLLQRFDQEKVGKWAQHSKNRDEKEDLEAENRELLERIETLEKNSTQDQVRIKELQQQIEQLKNIENIIKNRER